MRRLRCVLCLALALASCTIGTEPAATTLPHDTMSSAVLDHQDPGSDTSNNEILRRSEASHRQPNGAWLVAIGLAEMAIRNR